MKQMTRYAAVSLALCLFSAGEVFAADFLISDMGPDDDTTGLQDNFRGINSSVAYNSTNDQYMVVWWGDDDTVTANNEFEIFGQCIDTDTGASVLTDDLRISFMGETEGDINLAGKFPSIAYNSTRNEYLVAWWGDDDRGALINDDFEVFGQIINAADCTLKGSNFTISDMGGTGEPSIGVNIGHESAPAVAYNATDDEYLVLWHREDTTTSNEIEIFGQILDGDGTEKVDDFRVSGPPGPFLAAVSPAVAYNPDDGQYLVVWWGDFDVANDFEVYGQLVDADTDGVGVGGSQLLRISLMGGAGDAIDPPNGGQFIGRFPDVAYNAIDKEYLVVWEGDDDNLGVNDEFEIFGKILHADGTQKVATYKISEMGFEGSAIDPAFGVRHDGDPNPTTEDTGPAVVYNAINNEYLVVWEADDNEGDLINDEYEIYGQRLTGGTGAPVDGDFRISDMGATDGSTAFTATYPAVAFDSTDDVYLTVWHGDDDTFPQIDDEQEVWGDFSAPIFRISDTSDVTVAEDSGTLQLSVERVGDLDGVASVGFTITGASASDYTDLTTTVSFADGDGAAQSVDVVNIADDTVDENDETITITLANASAGSKISATEKSVDVTITDNDTSGGGNGGGDTGDTGGSDTSDGGCSLGSSDGFDPLFPLLMLTAVGYLLRRGSLTLN